MATRLYMDVHVPQSISDQLRRRGADVITAIEDGLQAAPDDELLERARQLGRVIFTQDIRFMVLVQTWQRQHRSSADLLFGHQLGGTIGQYVRDLELIVTASEQEEWMDVVERLPFQE
jgi:hypothetical protein